jgi:hypothetical protein
LRSISGLSTLEDFTPLCVVESCVQLAIARRTPATNTGTSSLFPGVMYMVFSHCPSRTMLIQWARSQTRRSAVPSARSLRPLAAASHPGARLCRVPASTGLWPLLPGPSFTAQRGRPHGKCAVGILVFQCKDQDPSRPTFSLNPNAHPGTSWITHSAPPGPWLFAKPSTAAPPP